MGRSASWGWGKGYDGREAARQAAQQALSHLGTARPALGLVFVSQEFEMAPVVNGLVSVLGNVPFWGISTTRAIIPTGEQARSVVVALLAGNDLNAKVSYWPAFSQNSEETANQLIQSLFAETDSLKGLLLAADGINGDISRVCAAMTDFSSPGKTDTFLAKAVNYLAKGVEPVTRFTNYVAIVVLSLMMFLTAIDVLLRYAFNKPIPGDLEITQFMMSIVVATSIGYCAYKKGHIIVDTFFNKLSPRAREIFNIFHYLVGAALFALICWRTALEGLVVQGRNITSPVVLIPVFPFYWLAAFGCAVLCLAWLFSAIESLSLAITSPSRNIEENQQGV